MSWRHHGTCTYIVGLDLVASTEAVTEAEVTPGAVPAIRGARCTTHQLILFVLFALSTVDEDAVSFRAVPGTAGTGATGH